MNCCLPCDPCDFNMASIINQMLEHIKDENIHLSEDDREKLESCGSSEGYGADYVTTDSLENYYTKTECDATFLKKDHNFDFIPHSTFIATIGLLRSEIEGSKIDIGELDDRYLAKTLFLGTIASLATKSELNKYATKEYVNDRVGNGGSYSYVDSFKLNDDNKLVLTQKGAPSDKSEFKVTLPTGSTPTTVTYTTEITESTSNSYKIGELKVNGETYPIYGKDVVGTGGGSGGSTGGDSGFTPPQFPDLKKFEMWYSDQSDLTSALIGNPSTKPEYWKDDDNKLSGSITWMAMKTTLLRYDGNEYKEYQYTWDVWRTRATIDSIDWDSLDEGIKSEINSKIEAYLNLTSEELEGLLNAATVVNELEGRIETVEAEIGEGLDSKLSTLKLNIESNVLTITNSNIKQTADSIVSTVAEFNVDNILSNPSDFDSDSWTYVSKTLVLLGNNYSIECHERDIKSGPIYGTALFEIIAEVKDATSFKILYKKYDATKGSVDDKHSEEKYSIEYKNVDIQNYDTTTLKVITVSLDNFLFETHAGVDRSSLIGIEFSDESKFGKNNIKYLGLFSQSIGSGSIIELLKNSINLVVSNQDKYAGILLGITEEDGTPKESFVKLAADKIVVDSRLTEMIGDLIVNGDFVSNSISTNGLHVGDNTHILSDGTILIGDVSGEGDTKILFNPDGSGYVANGAITWDKNGNSSIESIINNRVNTIDVLANIGTLMLIKGEDANNAGARLVIGVDCEESTQRPVLNDNNFYMLDINKCPSVIVINNIDRHIILPYFVTKGKFFRTATKDNDIIRPITYDDMIKCVGKEITFFVNNDNGTLYKLVTNGGAEAGRHTSTDTYEYLNVNGILYLSNIDACGGADIRNGNSFKLKFVHGTIDADDYVRECFYWQLQTLESVRDDVEDAFDL